MYISYGSKAKLNSSLILGRLSHCLRVRGKSEITIGSSHDLVPNISLFQKYLLCCFRASKYPVIHVSVEDPEAVALEGSKAVWTTDS